MTPERFTILLQKYLRHELTEDESAALLEAAADPDMQRILEASVDGSFKDNTISGLSTPEQTEMALERFRNIIHPAYDTKTVRMRHWGRYAAAAVLLILATGTWWWARTVPPQLPPVTAVADVMPGSVKATLTLADGSVISLDSAGHQQIRQGAASIQQNGGSLAYHSSNSNTAISYNVLTIPRGGQFQLVLSDGTKVWLNAASSMRYPVTFTGNERLVEITGEAYFEVAQNAKQPFRVKVNKRSAIEILGTTFNVNGYEDEPTITTTLLSGAVRVHSEKHSVVLQPGQQAIDRAGTEHIAVVNNADTEKATAWKNGLFNFENARVDEVMRQIARWYDLEIVYEKGIPDIYFVGEMSRNIKLTGLLKALEDSKVHFRLEAGKRLIVLP